MKNMHILILPITLRRYILEFLSKNNLNALSLVNIEFCVLSRNLEEQLVRHLKNSLQNMSRLGLSPLLMKYKSLLDKNFLVRAKFINYCEHAYLKKLLNFDIEGNPRIFFANRYAGNLISTISKKDLTSLSWLLQFNPSNSVDQYKKKIAIDIALLSAVREKSLKMVKILSSYGANPNFRLNFRQPLDAITFHQRAEFYDGCTPLALAAFDGWEKGVDYFILKTAVKILPAD